MSKPSGNGLISKGPVAQNRRARFDYAISDTFEVGIVLTGTEVKSLRHGHCNITEAYAGRMGDGIDVWLYNAYIPEYQSKSPFSHETRRPRKLLLHRKEARRLLAALARQGMSLVPMSLYFNDRGIAKLQLGLGSGKKKGDKRETVKERDWNRQKQRLMRDKG
ncbi:SsrA-binding protein SmpB [Haematospirillum jordaniae]|uniref:SsrA-binding protein n=1 Tax=Haematospirillum jordaniae TaxID=1549855 RepID=A0A143DF11_9PROT|nr:SsrA-binding protein SmpB [Haematospirillum jordaniae]AMW35256.1 SsrA-binding protein [Haematospirillum jordaniae]NKD45809.1 SsrA-binding protein SmpB [Haematospirillum jordaniae]NKD56340.1 SsrA-binding protein SmpB [Haematospirillum jordaniae]NKD58398.1 SsrA-binding protein SmpB [Haematospirillum jordaniae]NKD66433.1 SsrA-binding protein SmpB [Haematospirillum jordaniae]